MRSYKAALAAVVLALVAGAKTAQAATQTPWTKVTFIATGWVDKTFRFYTEAPVANPENCASTDGYVVPDSLPGNDHFLSTIIAAYSLNHEVALIINSCVNDRPQVIGVYVRKPQ
ncbi:hypothetical protein [Nitrospirillum iridis]|uniref:Uncharacterized protein n=1 Tax=Nitrospirillum iridis TaxID=765888 RepID=A0A7X0B1S1_9PROT|nr:hypothetical protein [Nitrospirillum iridis]MBB6253391.1 hypothetical protein [Nitrospirillum iridis]